MIDEVKFLAPEDWCILFNDIFNENSAILSNCMIVFINENLRRDFDKWSILKSAIRKIKFDIQKNSRPISKNLQNTLSITKNEISFSKKIIK